MNDLLQINFEVLGRSQLFIHCTSIAVTALAFIFSRKLISLGRSGDPSKLHNMILRVILVSYLAFEIVDIIILHAVPEYNRPLYKGALSILTVFFGIVLNNILGRWAKSKFGTEKRIDGEIEIVATYHSQLTTILFSVVSTMFVIFFLIKIWELNSLLETTGFIGIIAAFLVLTNSIWLPDIYHGLVILNSNLLGDGDAIRLERDGPIYVIHKMSFVYTSLLNIENNNRAMIRNSKISENMVENLTKRASVDGLRQKLTFKVSYPKFNMQKYEDLDSETERFYKRLDQMFSDACDYIQETESEYFAKNSRFDWGIMSAGDNALELVMYYYLAPLPATKVAKKVRMITYQTRQKIVYAVYRQSVLMGIDLATPALVNIDEGAKRDKCVKYAKPSPDKGTETAG